LSARISTISSSSAMMRSVVEIVID
jgi:hypothetical protein